MAHCKGTVRSFSNLRGCGFLRRDGGEDVFVHYSSIERDLYQTLKEGESVEFDVVQGEKGAQADHVTVVRDKFGSEDSFWTALERPVSQVRTPRSDDRSTDRVRVLVADDEHVIANSLTLILNKSGFEARAVYSGMAAVEALSSFEPDILLSDVMMPGMTGIEAAIAIRARHPRCKVVLLSGQAATANLLQDAEALGHRFEILAKPVHPEYLLEKLRAGELSLSSAS